MYIPVNGMETHWVLQNGQRRLGQPKTVFTNNGPYTGASITWTLGRYGDPRSSEEIAAGTNTLAAYKFPHEITKGVLPGSIRTAGEHADNKWGITPQTDTLKAIQQAIDIQATIADEVIAAYPSPGNVGDWPIKMGDSTNPHSPTHGNWRRPYGLFSPDGKHFYFNDRAEKPNDPWVNKPATPNIAATAPSPISSNKLEDIINQAKKELVSIGESGGGSVMRRYRSFLHFILGDKN
jgi:hypothetical protein